GGAARNLRAVTKRNNPNDCQQDGANNVARLHLLVDFGWRWSTYTGTCISGDDRISPRRRSTAVGRGHRRYCVAAQALWAGLKPKYQPRHGIGVLQTVCIHLQACCPPIAV